jgi:hypothetical protein
MRFLPIVPALTLALVVPAPAAPAGTSCIPKAMNGTPCKPFLNRARTLRFARATLLANGFYSAGLRLTVASLRRINYVGIQDGEKMWGAVFKTGDRRLWITFTTFGWGRSYTFKTSFVA